MITFYVILLATFIYSCKKIAKKCKEQNIEFDPMNAGFLLWMTFILSLFPLLTMFCVNIIPKIIHIWVKYIP
jgi:hypothetical protein